MNPSAKFHFKIKSGLKAGIGTDARAYCMQSCVTQESQCKAAGRTDCDESMAQCLGSCTNTAVTSLGKGVYVVA